MTEEEWLTSTDPAAMLQIVSGGVGTLKSCQASDRKLRLWVEACRSADDRDDRAFGNYDLETEGGLMAACAAWLGCHQSVMPIDPLPRRAALLRDIVGNPFRPVTLPDGYEWFISKIGTRNARCLICDYVACGKKISRSHREFCHYSCPWITPTVLTLAQAAYEGREERKCKACDGLGRVLNGGYDPLPRHSNCLDCHGTGHIDDGTLDPDRLLVLTDAMLDAGCDDVDLIMHLRGLRYVDERTHATEPLPAPHVRGCWAVDLILGKE